MISRTDFALATELARLSTVCQSVARARADGSDRTSPQLEKLRTPHQRTMPSLRALNNTGVSGVLFSQFCHDAYAAGDGREMVFIHNVFAINPVQPGTFSIGQEWGRVGESVAMMTDWRKADGLIRRSQSRVVRLRR
jgi:hypothetical protein